MIRPEYVGDLLIEILGKPFSKPGAKDYKLWDGFLYEMRTAKPTHLVKVAVKDSGTSPTGYIEGCSPRGHSRLEVHTPRSRRYSFLQIQIAIKHVKTNRVHHGLSELLCNGFAGAGPSCVGANISRLDQRGQRHSQPRARWQVDSRSRWRSGSGRRQVYDWAEQPCHYQAQ
jgi:hypothetical protein